MRGIMKFWEILRHSALSVARLPTEQGYWKLKYAELSEGLLRRISNDEHRITNDEVSVITSTLSIGFEHDYPNAYYFIWKGVLIFSSRYFTTRFSILVAACFETMKLYILLFSFCE